MSGPDRSRPPEPGELPPLELPDFRRFQLESGLDVWVAEDRQLPEVSVRLIVEAGAVAEDDGRRGTAELTSRLLTEGAGERSAPETAEWLDRLGASFQASAGYDVTSLNLHTLSDVLDGTLDFLRAVAREPAFAPDELKRVRAETADELERERDEADVVADHALIRAVYGDHRYGTPSAGEPETVRSLDRDAVTGFHGRRYGAAGAAVVACGDVDPAALRDALAERFGDWEAGEGRTPPPAPPEEAGDAGRVLVVDRPASAQAEVRLGTVGLARGDEGFFPALVGNAVLGGLFNSRVNMNLREEKGWTYGASTSLHFRRVAGPFVAGAAVETEAAGPALSEFLDEIRGMWERPPDDEELALARNSLVLSLPRRFETVSQVTSQVATLLVHDLPEDWWSGYRDRVEAVGRDDAVEALRRLLAPERLTAVVVAAADEVVPDLEDRFDRVEVVPAP